MSGEYGESIVVGARVELHPGCDLWMSGAKYGEVIRTGGGIAIVQVDHPHVRKPRAFRLERLRRID